MADRDACCARTHVVMRALCRGSVISEQQSIRRCVPAADEIKLASVAHRQNKCRLRNLQMHLIDSHCSVDFPETGAQQSHERWLATADEVISILFRRDVPWRVGGSNGSALKSPIG